MTQTTIALTRTDSGAHILGDICDVVTAISYDCSWMARKLQVG